MKSISRIALVLCLCAAAALAADFAALKPQGYVSDFAGVIDPNSRAQLERYCEILERSTGAQLALVTLPSLQGEPVEDVANALFRAWGIGKKGENNGALLLLSINDRRSRLEVGYGLEPIITDGESGSLLRAMAPDLRNGQYGPALLTAATEIGSKIAQAKNVALESPAPARPRRHRREAPVIPLLVFGAIMFVLFSLSARRGGRGGPGGFLPGLIIGTLLNQRGGGGFYRGGGGGFGGYDSGGGFGGFGGGDSGGGGASGSW